MANEGKIFIILDIAIRVLKAFKFIFSGKHTEKKDNEKPK